MRKKILKSVLCLLLLGSCDSCLEKGEARLCLENESAQDISVLLGGVQTTADADTILPNIDALNLLHKIPKGKQCDMGGVGKIPDWDEIFEYLSIDTMRIFILATDTVNMYDWNIIQKNYNILQRYDVSVEDLRYLNGCLYYPPISTMRDIRMWPPYSQ